MLFKKLSIALGALLLSSTMSYAQSDDACWTIDEVVESMLNMFEDADI